MNRTITNTGSTATAGQRISDAYAGQSAALFVGMSIAAVALYRLAFRRKRRRHWRHSLHKPWSRFGRWWRSNGGWVLVILLPSVVAMVIAALLGASVLWVALIGVIAFVGIWLLLLLLFLLLGLLAAIFVSPS